MARRRLTPLRPLPEALDGAEREYAEELRRWYRRSGFSLKELERVTNCSDSNWSRYLRGQALADDATLRPLAQVARATRPEWLHVQNLRRDAEAARRARVLREVPPAARPGDPAAGPPREYETDSLDATCRFEGRHIALVETVLVLRAVADAVTTFRQIYYCSRDGGVPGRIDVHAGGVVVADEPVGRPNFRMATIELPQPLATGDRHRLRFDVVYPGRKESEPWFVINLMRPAESIAVRLAFDAAALPSYVWRVERVPTEARGGDKDVATRLHPDRLGYVAAEFADPEPPFNYGIAWEW